MDEQVIPTVRDVLLLLGGMVVIAAAVLAWVVKEVKGATKEIRDLAMDLHRRLSAHESEAAATYVSRAELAATEQRLDAAGQAREARLRDEIAALRAEVQGLGRRCAPCAPAPPAGQQ